MTDLLTPEQARQAIIGFRLTTGTLGALAPRPLGRMFGIRPEDNPAGPFIGRLFAFRNLALGAVLTDGDEEEVRRWLQWGVAIDVADAAAALAGGLRGYLSKRATGSLVAVAATVAALGVIASRDA
jgi:hypothetical protein